MVRRSGLVALLLLLVGVGVGVAHADRAKARDLYERGTKAYNLRDYPRALDLFKQSYEEQSESALLFNIAQCQRQLGQHESASWSYRMYLNETPNAPNRAEVSRHIKAMDDAAREQRAKEPPSMATPPPTVPAPMPAQVTEKPKTPPPVEQLTPRPPTPARAWYKSAPAWGVGAAGFALVALGGGLAGYGQMRRSDQDTLPSLPERNAAADDAGVFRPTGYALVGVGAAVVVTGVVLFAVAAKQRK